MNEFYGLALITRSCPCTDNVATRLEFSLEPFSTSYKCVYEQRILRRTCADVHVLLSLQWSHKREVHVPLIQTR